MGDMNEFDDEESYEEYYDEEEPLQPKVLVLSILRQVICCGSVLTFSYFFLVFANLGLPADYNSPHYYAEGKYTIGGTMGYICGGITWYFMGCKATVIAGNVLNLPIAVLAYFVYETINYSRYSQYITSFVGSFSSLAFTIYVAGIADNTCRAFFMGLFFVGNYAVALKFNSLSRVGELHVVHRFSVVLALCSTVSSIFLPETPFSLARKGDPAKAKSVFTWIRAGGSDAAECDLMLAQAQNIAQRGGLVKRILSPTFAVGMAICFFLDTCELHPCDPHIVFAYEKYVRKKVAGLEQQKALAQKFRDILLATSTGWEFNILRGSLLYQVLCFAIPRKILYTGSIVVDLLLSVPFLLQMDIELLKTIAPYCFTSLFMGRFQSVFLLPVEIFPAILRPVGVTTSYIIYRIMAFVREYTMVPEYTIVPAKSPSVLLPRRWLYFNIAATFIGIPFILLFMPETKGMNLYELDELKLPFKLGSTTKDTDTDDNDTELAEEKVTELDAGSEI